MGQPVMQPRLKLWLERDGRIVMSDYRLRLLQLVAETGSLADAAQQMDLSYRRAWGKVKELEHNLGIPLLRSTPGGTGGGHSEITPEGLDLLRRYAEFQRRAADAVQRAFEAAFAGTPSSGGPADD